jgi:hypothetical protein
VLSLSQARWSRPLKTPLSTSKLTDNNFLLVQLSVQLSKFVAPFSWGGMEYNRPQLGPHDGLSLANVARPQERSVIRDRHDVYHYDQQQTGDTSILPSWQSLSQRFSQQAPILPQTTNRTPLAMGTLERQLLMLRGQSSYQAPESKFSNFNSSSRPFQTLPRAPQPLPPPPPTHLSRIPTTVSAQQAFDDKMVVVKDSNHVEHVLRRMEPETRSAMIEFANRLKEIMEVAFRIYELNSELSDGEFYAALVSSPQVGPLSKSILSVAAGIPMETLMQLYEKIFKGVERSSQDLEALKALWRSFKAGHRALQRGEQSAKSTGLPEYLEVTCNGKPGNLHLSSQTIHCYCKFCTGIAEGEGKGRRYLRLSFPEFERHCGLGNSKKWKYTIRVVHPPTSLGQWFEDMGILIKHNKGEDDDDLVQRAERETALRRAERAREQSHLAFGMAFGGGKRKSRAPAQLPGDLRGEAETGDASEYAPPDMGANGINTGFRTQRQRKKPSWMKQTVDPSHVLSNRPALERSSSSNHDLNEIYVDDVDDNQDDYDVIAVNHNRNGAKRQHIDPEEFIEEDILVALEQNATPVVKGWRINDATSMAVTIRLGDVTFSGLLPAVRSDRVRRDAHPSPSADVVDSGQPPPVVNETVTVPVDTAEKELVPPQVAVEQATALKNDPIVETGTKQSKRDHVPMEERRLVAAIEYERLLVAGPPPDAKCALCHLQETDAVPRSQIGVGGRSLVGLGKLTLVRASAVNNVWVHDQCLRWSPEVHDPT